MANRKPEPYQLCAVDVVAQIRKGELTTVQYAQSLLSRIQERDPIVKAWAYIDPEYVLEQARRLDEIAPQDRGPLHGVAVAVKDVIVTKDMPTQCGSPIYDGDAPKIDAASVMVLRHAGAIILGKTTTTEFAAVTVGTKTSNPHDPTRTPGGSSSGSGAAIADFQAPIGLGTQTGGSTIRPGSFNGIYAMKPTWNSISREGQKIYSLIYDTLGLYTRSIDDLDLLADVFALHDDTPAPDQFEMRGAKFAICKTMVWDEAGPGTVAAMDKAKQLLEAAGAQVDEIEFPESMTDFPKWYKAVIALDGETAFLPEYRTSKEKLSDAMKYNAENRENVSHAEQLDGFDKIACARPVVDSLLRPYAATIVPSVPDEAPIGLESTGSAAFNGIWTWHHGIKIGTFYL
ncbi:Amidase [Penicillium occitanis (nom. inval.)]|nr:Amidase [Penicillium occitanis (nom. inval.)]PCH02105.1 hypothetical protein PENOC_044940 [Penicillium occitanis (nom. inval.)]